MSKNLGVYWVCETCLHAEANGVDLRYESDWGMDYDPETNPSPYPEPWALLGPGQHAACGMANEEHDESCHLGVQDDETGECDCEVREFSTSACEGCGNYLHGTRHAMTVFQD